MMTRGIAVMLVCLRRRDLRSVARPGGGAHIRVRLYRRAPARSSPTSETSRMRARLLLRDALRCCAVERFARGEFDPTHEFEHHEWIPIHIGPLDMSINEGRRLPDARRARRCALGILLMRWRGVEPDTQAGARRDDLRDRADPGRRAGPADEGDRPLVPRTSRRCWSSSGSSTCSASSRCRSPARRSRSAASAPDAGHLRGDVHDLRDAGARPDDLRLHARRGHPHERVPVGYFKSWIPDVPKAMLPLIVPLEILGQFMRLISLSVRLYANMLAGPHADPHLHRPDLRDRDRAAGAGRRARGHRLLPLRGRDRRLIQAYIFAALSAIYIGSAIEPEH